MYYDASVSTDIYNNISKSINVIQNISKFYANLMND